MTSEQRKIFKKWVEALRSGKYIRGTGRLRTKEKRTIESPDSFCCLGVACDVVDPNGWRHHDQIQYLWREEKPGSLLPKCHPLFNIISQNNGLHFLVSMNDHEGRSFYEIADYIEETYIV